jgi:ribosomal protein S18 acetylase RimI-like enzyme
MYSLRPHVNGELRSHAHMARGFEVAAATTVDDALMEAMSRLLPQLSKTAAIPDADAIREIVASPRTALLLAHEQSSRRIAGMLTLVCFRIPAGVRARIEDVVVDEAERGHGIGETLCRTALRIAAEQGASAVELTSHPSREAANKMYRKLGFVSRDTNTYRFMIQTAV